MALVSVAMATYNGEKYLSEQLESIIGQTYEPIELVVVDDCSSDNTREILNAFTRKHKEIVRVYENPSNIGVVRSFEKALRHCNGSFVALCDQDDIWAPNKIERLVEEIEQYSLIYSDLSLVDSTGKVLCKSRTDDKRINNRSGIPLEDLILSDYIIGCSVLFKKELLESALPIPTEAFLHDWWIAVIASKTHGIKYLHEPLTAYRQHSHNLYGARDKTFFKKLMQLLSRSDDKTHIFQRKLMRLRALNTISDLSAREKKQIGAAASYYNSYLEDRCLFRHWALTVLLLDRLSVKRSRIREIARKWPRKSNYGSDKP